MTDIVTPIDEHAANSAAPTTPGTEPEPEPEFMSVKELAALLHLNVKTVYRQADKGKIPGVRRVGRSFRAHRRTVISWFTAGPRRDPRRDRWQ